MSEQISGLPTTFQREPEPAPPPARFGARIAAAVAPEAVEWLWPERFALGKLGLLIGEPDNGKSLLLIDLAARVSRGRPWPDAAPGIDGEVLLVAGEDGAADTVRPRLEAAGADLERIHLSHEVATGGRGFSLARDLAALEAWLAEHAEVRLLALDPLGAWLGGAGAGERAMRQLMAPLAALAQRARLAAIGIVHLSKRGAAKPIHRVVQGSPALVAAAQHVYAVGRDRCDPARRLMARVKNNLSADETGMVFAIESAAGGTPVLAWESEPMVLDAEGVLREAETADEKQRTLLDAQYWLQWELEKGPNSVAALQHKASVDGLSWRSIQRAKARVGARARKVGYQGETYWCWQLPLGAGSCLRSPPAIASCSADWQPSAAFGDSRGKRWLPSAVPRAAFGSLRHRGSRDGQRRRRGGPMWSARPGDVRVPRGQSIEHHYAK